MDQLGFYFRPETVVFQEIPLVCGNFHQVSRLHRRVYPKYGLSDVFISMLILIQFI